MIKINFSRFNFPEFNIVSTLKKSGIVNKALQFIIKNQIHEIGGLVVIASTFALKDKIILKASELANLVKDIISDRSSYIKSIESKGIGKNFTICTLSDNQYDYNLDVEEFFLNNSHTSLGISEQDARDCRFILMNEINISCDDRSTMKLIELKNRFKGCKEIISFIEKTLQPLFMKSLDELILFVAKLQENKTIMDILSNQASALTNITGCHVLRGYLSSMTSAHAGVIDRLKVAINTHNISFRRKLTLESLVSKEKAIISHIDNLKNKLDVVIARFESQATVEEDEVDFGRRKKDKSVESDTTDKKKPDPQLLQEKKRGFSLGACVKFAGIEVGLQTGYESHKIFK